MPTVTWSPLSLLGDIAGTALNSLNNGGTSPIMSYDNSTTRHLYARAALTLGSFTPGAAASVTLRVLGHDGTNHENVVFSSPHQDAYAAVLLAGAGVKRIVFPMVRLYPWNVGFVLINQAGATLAASGHSLVLHGYGEDV